MISPHPCVDCHTRIERHLLAERCDDCQAKHERELQNRGEVRRVLAALRAIGAYDAPPNVEAGVIEYRRRQKTD